MSHVVATVGLAERYRRVRAQTEALCAPLEIEDYVVQPMVDASPPKWHLAHTSWFFETFVLKPFAAGAYREIDPRYAYLFNSYYVQAGDRHCRDQRGMVTRPTVRETYAYRAHVDQAVLALLERHASGGEPDSDLEARLVLGLHHEQQHQELLVTDVKYALSRNPLRPAYQTDLAPAAGSGGPGGEPGGGRGGARGASTRGGRDDSLGWLRFSEGLEWIGFDGAGGGGVPGGGSAAGEAEGASSRFCFDNETPRHRRLVHAFALAERPVTNGEYAEFIADGGYRRPELWLSDGWAAAQAAGWSAPLYWEPDGAVFTLGGLRALDRGEPVCHVSYYEADAFARWRGLRLPDEAEWEVAARREAVEGNFLESGRHHPGPARAGLYGDVWVWTMSPYNPYPGYRPAPGALGEYNGKFMVNQMVLRGGSCATPRSHIRSSYRNFFHPDARWQFSGIRLARDE